jgi:hypothetical protein
MAHIKKQLTNHTMNAAHTTHQSQNSVQLRFMLERAARAALALAFILTLASCKMVAPSVQPFEDYNDFMLTRPLTYWSPTLKQSITVPEGFVTDYASIPKPVEGWFSRKNKRYQTAAIVHDWLYWNGYDKTKADEVLYEAARDSGVRWVDGQLIWAGVSIGGQGPWNDNQELRTKGYLRVIPLGKRDPHTWPDSWPKFRDDLFKEGFRANN